MSKDEENNKMNENDETENDVLRKQVEFLKIEFEKVKNGVVNENEKNEKEELRKQVEFLTIEFEKLKKQVEEQQKIINVLRQQNQATHPLLPNTKLVVKKKNTPKVKVKGIHCKRIPNHLFKNIPDPIPLTYDLRNQPYRKRNHKYFRRGILEVREKIEEFVDPRNFEELKEVLFKINHRLQRADMNFKKSSISGYDVARMLYHDIRNMMKFLLAGKEHIESLILPIEEKDERSLYSPFQPEKKEDDEKLRRQRRQGKKKKKKKKKNMRKVNVIYFAKIYIKYVVSYILVLRRISICYYHLEDYKNAIEFCQEALDIMNEPYEKYVGIPGGEKPSATTTTTDVSVDFKGSRDIIFYQLMDIMISMQDFPKASEYVTCIERESTRRKASQRLERVIDIGEDVYRNRGLYHRYVDSRHPRKEKNMNNNNNNPQPYSFPFVHYYDHFKPVSKRFVSSKNEFFFKNHLKEIMKIKSYERKKNNKKKKKKKKNKGNNNILYDMDYYDERYTLKQQEKILIMKSILKYGTRIYEYPDVNIQTTFKNRVKLAFEKLSQVLSENKDCLIIIKSGNLVFGGFNHNNNWKLSSSSQKSSRFKGMEETNKNISKKNKEEEEEEEGEDEEFVENNNTFIFGKHSNNSKIYIIHPQKEKILQEGRKGYIMSVSRDSFGFCSGLGDGLFFMEPYNRFEGVLRLRGGFDDPECGVDRFFPGPSDRFVVNRLEVYIPKKDEKKERKKEKEREKKEKKKKKKKKEDQKLKKKKKKKQKEEEEEPKMNVPTTKENKKMVQDQIEEESEEEEEEEESSEESSEEEEEEDFREKKLVKEEEEEQEEQEESTEEEEEEEEEESTEEEES